MSDLERLIYHLEYDYAKAAALQKNLTYQLAKRHALVHKTSQDPGKIELLLQQVIKSTGDYHVRLEPLSHKGKLTINDLYDNHFRAFYQSSGTLAPISSGDPGTASTHSPKLGLLSEDVVMWQLPSSHVRYYAVVRELVERYQQALASVPYWIIDIRGNSGGTDRMWSYLWSFLSNGLLRQGGTVFRVSVGNLEYFKLASEYAHSWQVAEDAAWYDAVVKAMAGAGKRFVIPDLPGFYPQTYYSQPLDNPQKVIILIDQQTASAAETLVEMAKQSHKVLIVGQSASMGCVDSGNLRFVPLPSLRYGLYFGTSLNLNAYRVSIDKGGYQPDILLPQGDPSLVIPWSVAYLQQDWQRLQKIERQFSLQK